MKVYKVVSYTEVEKFTMDGWELDKVLGRSYATSMSCQTPVSVAVPDGCYGNVNTHLRDEPVQVHEPLFLLTKDLDVVQKEMALATQLSEVTGRVKELEEGREQRKKRFDALGADLKSSKEETAKFIKERDNRSAVARKLEDDIGKIRTALGDLRMKEILG